MLIPYTRGWDELMELAPLPKLLAAHRAIADGAKLDIGPHVAAYEKHGFASPSSPLPKALHAVFEATTPRIVQWDEVIAALREVARHLGDTAAAAANEKMLMLFPMFPGPKSNLWIFLILMHELKKLAGPKRWAAWSKDIHICVASREGEEAEGAVKKGAARKYHLVLCDDCVYSGEQIARLCKTVVKAYPPERVTYCPAFSTASGIQHVYSSSSLPHPIRMAIHVPGGILGYPTGTVDALATRDCAFCFRNATGWVIVSLFEVLGVMSHSYMVSHSHSSTANCGCASMPHHTPPFQQTYDTPWSEPWFNEVPLSVRSRMRGHTTTVFAHKLADGVSLPWGWLAMGGTLKAFMADACKTAACDLSADMEVLVAPLDVVLAEVAHWAHAKKSRRIDAHSMGLVCAPNLLDPARVLGAAKGEAFVASRVKLSKMPQYVPLLQPSTACGPGVDAALRRGRADGKEKGKRKKDPSDSAYWVEKDLPNAAFSGRCNMAPYKDLLRNDVLQKVRGRLASALNLA